MSKTFHFQHAPSVNKMPTLQARKLSRQQKRQRQNDAFCTYLLGPLDDEGRHAQAQDPADRVFRRASLILNGS